MIARFFAWLFARESTMRCADCGCETEAHSSNLCPYCWWNTPYV